MANKLVTVVVVYNKLIKDITVTNTLNNEYIDFCFVDNSTNEEIKNNNISFCQENNYQYINMNGNKGLSKAYNEAIDILKNNYQYILLSDDDTIYNKEYIDELLIHVNENKYDLILPHVVDKVSNQILTPTFYSNLPLKRVNQEQATRIGGINSGSCIKLTTFNNWRYNEDLFMYFTDLDFYNNNVNINKLSFIILKSTIYQNCAGSVEYGSTTKDQIKRVLKDAKKYFKTRNFGYIQYWLYKVLLVSQSLKQHKKLTILSLLFA